MFCGNVRDKQRGTDEKPTDIAARQKIIFGCSLFPRKIEPDAEHDDEVNGDDGDINGSQRSVCRGCCTGRSSLTHESCEEHSCLPLFQMKRKAPSTMRPATSAKRPSLASPAVPSSEPAGRSGAFKRYGKTILRSVYQPNRPLNLDLAWSRVLDF